MSVWTNVDLLPQIVGIYKTKWRHPVWFQAGSWTSAHHNPGAPAIRDMVSYRSTAYREGAFIYSPDSKISQGEENHPVPPLSWLPRLLRSLFSSDFHLMRWLSSLTSPCQPPWPIAHGRPASSPLLCWWPHPATVAFQALPPLALGDLGPHSGFLLCTRPSQGILAACRRSQLLGGAFLRQTLGWAGS